MTTKRTPLRRDVRARVTPQLVALWRTLREIQEAGADEAFEPHGRRNEYLDAFHALNALFGVRPWQESPADVYAPEPPDTLHLADHDSWRRAWEWRCALEAAR